MPHLAFLILLSTGAVWAVPSPVEDTANSSQTADDAFYHQGFGEGRKDTGHSVAPVVGYDPFYKFVYGAAYFYESPVLKWGVDGNLNFNGVYQLYGRFNHTVSEGWQYGGKFGLVRGFQPYYGEGGETSVQDLQRLWGDQASVSLRLVRTLGRYLALGVFSEFRGRTEVQHGNEPFARAIPDQSATVFGLTTQIDTRKDKAKSNEGFVFTTEVAHGPSSLNRPANQSFTKLESSFVVYKEIMSEVFPDVVAAFRVMGGVMAGEAPFTFRYQLGGANLLRGYLENRFRGSKYYLQQTELRFPIFKMVGAAASLGFGDISDGTFTNAKMAYGIGLRVGLPPDWISKIRVDIAWGRDQMGVFANFGQTF